MESTTVFIIAACIGGIIVLPIAMVLIFMKRSVKNNQTDERGKTIFLHATKTTWIAMLCIILIAWIIITFTMFLSAAFYILGGLFILHLFIWSFSMMYFNTRF